MIDPRPSYRVCAALAVAVIVTVGMAAPVCHAIVPYWSYTYDVWQQPVPAPLAYVPVKTIDGLALDVGELREPGDLFVDDAGRIYIADTGNNRLVCLDSTWNVDRVIEEFDNNGEADRFNSPRGIYVTPEASMYVADTGNGRVVVLDSDGRLVREIGAPVSEVAGVIPDDFRYRPIRLAVGIAGQVLVIVEGEFDGIVEFDHEGVFKGFFGAPKVTPSLIEVLWTKIASREQREQMALFLPTEYSSIDLDSRGFIYATIATGDMARSQPIRRLSPAGKSVLRALGFIAPRGDKPFTTEELQQGKPPSKFVDVVARENGIYSALDLNRGRVFTYDVDGHLLYEFGSRAYQLGGLIRPAAIEELHGNLLVLDAETNSVTVYEPTQYAVAIHRALAYYHRGDYESSDRMWREILRLNANYDRAYTGIGSTYLMNEQFAEAMMYFRLGDNRHDYSRAYQYFRNEMVRRYFPPVVSAIVVLALTLFALARIGVFRRARGGVKSLYDSLNAWCTGRGGRVARAWLRAKETVRGLCYAVHVVFHPFDGFWDLRYESRGNVCSATVILLLACSSYVWVRQYTGFLFNWSDPAQLNVFRESASVLIPFFLWCVINWSLTTLLDGKGKVEDIYVASCYALTPLILINFPVTLVSNYLTLEEGGIYYSFLSFGVIWMGVLLFLGTMVTHHYDGIKTVYTSVLTCVGIVVAIFVGVFFFVLMDQVVAFVEDIVKELTLRM